MINRQHEARLIKNMKKFYHGTSIKNAINIIKRGFKTSHVFVTTDIDKAKGFGGGNDAVIFEFSKDYAKEQGLTKDLCLEGGVIVDIEKRGKDQFVIYDPDPVDAERFYHEEKQFADPEEFLKYLKCLPTRQN